MLNRGAELYELLAALVVHFIQSYENTTRLLAGFSVEFALISQ